MSFLKQIIFLVFIMTAVSLAKASNDCGNLFSKLSFRHWSDLKSELKKLRGEVREIGDVIRDENASNEELMAVLDQHPEIKKLVEEHWIWNHQEEAAEDIANLAPGALYLGGLTLPNNTLPWFTNWSKYSLRSADLRGSSFNFVNFYKTDFRDADLRGANLRFANIYRANFEGAVYDSETKFPLGFNPKKRGMVKAESFFRRWNDY